jgi:hypothetical protein
MAVCSSPPLVASHERRTQENLIFCHSFLYAAARADQARCETRRLFDECLELTRGDANAAAYLVLADALLIAPQEPLTPPISECLTVAQVAKCVEPPHGSHLSDVPNRATEVLSHWPRHRNFKERNRQAQGKHLHDSSSHPRVFTAATRVMDHDPGKSFPDHLASNVSFGFSFW